MQFTVHTSRSEAVCTTAGGKLISFTQDNIPLISGECSDGQPVCFPVACESAGSGKEEEYCVLSENTLLSSPAFAPVLLMPEKVSFVLNGNAQTCAAFPHRFQLVHTYTVNENGFSAKFTAVNRDDKPFVYHPDTGNVFCLPIPEGASADEYCLEIASVDTAGKAEKGTVKPAGESVCLDGTCDNSIRLADSIPGISTLAVAGPVEKQIRLFSEKNGTGIKIDPVGFRSLAVQLYKSDACICLKLLNYIPALTTELAAAKEKAPETTVPAGSECTVGYVVTIL